jgi:hypothetical protein
MTDWDVRIEDVLARGGWRLFLLRIDNPARVPGRINVSSPEVMPGYTPSVATDHVWDQPHPRPTKPVGRSSRARPRRHAHHLLAAHYRYARARVSHAGQAQRARLGNSRSVSVDLIVNGVAIESRVVPADEVARPIAASGSRSGSRRRRMATRSGSGSRSPTSRYVLPLPPNGARRGSSDAGRRRAAVFVQVSMPPPRRSTIGHV